MPSLQHSLLLFLCAFHPATAKLTKQQRILCQYPTPNPLTHCPPNTLLVAPSPPNSSTTTYPNTTTYPTIQSAILSLPPDNSTHYILITPGLYREKLNITRPGPLYLLGQTATPWTLTHNTVTVTISAATGGPNTTDNAFTSVLTIAPTLNASLTGSGPTGFPVPDSTPFGNVDFRAYNVDFENRFANHSAGPSLALSTGFANTGFYQCAFRSYQDTVYVGKFANCYMRSCEVAGQTDFLYGFGTAWVEGSEVVMRGCGGGVAAWKGSNTTSFANRFGVYVHGSRVVAANASVAVGMRGRCALGRPWNALHRSVFSESYLDASVRASGYVGWSASESRVGNGTFMAEYRSFGPGWNETGRREGGVTRVLSEEMWRPYSSPQEVFQYFKSGKTGNVGWIDWEA
ncbi:putative pectin methylesterase [Byssothecium circinans]|uniref:pectinesterase n=1 Tax=Byssothecium circinans TaxID=147558 RepID=A0A6A5U4X2_9PLEO|nr:putative pectin methylesterase [Byssothecium circinans]